FSLQSIDRPVTRSVFGRRRSFQAGLRVRSASRCGSLVDGSMRRRVKGATIGGASPLILQIRALTRSSPVLMIFEDAHWIDPTLGRAVDRIASMRNDGGTRFFASHSALAPENLITLPHLSVSSAMRLVYSLGDSASISPPSSAMRVLIVGSART